MRYLIERRTVYGRAIWAVVTTENQRGDAVCTPCINCDTRTVARCDTLEDAELVRSALSAGVA